MRVFHGLTGLQAQQNFVGALIFPVEVMAVVGGHHGNAGVVADLQQSPVDPLLPFQFVILQFQIKIVLTHDVAVLLGHPSGAGNVLLVEVVGHLAPVAGRECNQAFGFFR